MTGEGVRCCVDCGTSYPLTTDHFRLVNNRNGRPGNLQPCCRQCERQREAVRRQTPEAKAKRALANKKWGEKRKRAGQPVETPELLRRCPDCKREKPHTLEFFGPASKGPRGMNSYCRECVKKRSAANRDKHPEMFKTHYKNNRERLLKAMRAHYWERREEIRSYERARRKAPEVLQRLRVYDQNRRSRLKQASGKFTHEHLQLKLEMQGFKCLYCGKPMRWAESVEHKIPLSRGGTNWPANIGAACRSCNTRKNNKTPQEFRDFLAKN